MIGGKRKVRGELNGTCFKMEAKEGGGGRTDLTENATPDGGHEQHLGPIKKS